MTLDDSIVQDPRTADLVPGPRTAEPAQVGQAPWPEPWLPTRGTRPRSEYWDVETARWTSRSPVPVPRGAD